MGSREYLGLFMVGKLAEDRGKPLMAEWNSQPLDASRSFDPLASQILLKYKRGCQVSKSQRR